MKKIFVLLFIISLFTLSSCSFSSFYSTKSSTTTTTTTTTTDEIDYTELINEISLETMKTNVEIYVTSYNTVLGIVTSGSEVEGSGVIFYETVNDYYMVLTNNHVTVKDEDYDKVKYTIVDYKGNEYTAYLKDEEADYDLAVLYFEAGDEELDTIPLATVDPDEETEIVAIGNPGQQMNTITFGEVESYVEISLSNAEEYQSNVSFDVIEHTAEISAGSSGGALLNTDLELVGINYAGGEDSSGNFTYGAAIPIEKVNEFLDDYIWS